MVRQMTARLAVGMSTACEAIAARHAGVKVCGISCISNMASGLSEEELRHYIGDEVYYETYHGARQQYLAGSVLMGGGAGIVIAAAMVQGIVGRNYPNSAYAQRANAMCLLSYIVGTTTMLTGIPFLAIGSGRLKWVASDYNARQAPVSLDLGACPNGIGLCLRF